MAWHFPLPGSAGAAERVPDSIYAAIERHRELSADYTAAVDISSKLEEGPEFEAADEISGDRCRDLLDHADALSRLEPTTLAGVIALMRYVANLEEWQTPRDSDEFDGTPTDWGKAFCTTVANALDRAVIQIEMCDLESRRARDCRVLALDGEAVVLGRNEDVARPEVTDRVVAAAVAVWQLHGRAAVRKADQLMAEADAERRQAGIGKLPDVPQRVADRRRVTRSVREEEAVGAELSHRRRWCSGWNHRDPAAALYQHVYDIPLHAEVVRDDVRPLALGVRARHRRP